MKLGLGSQGGVVDVADVMLRAHVRNEALTRVATTLAQDFQDLFTRRHPLPPLTLRNGCAISALWVKLERKGVKIRRVNAFWIFAIARNNCGRIFKIRGGEGCKRCTHLRMEAIIDITTRGYKGEGKECY